MKANSFSLFLVSWTLYVFASNPAFSQQTTKDFPEFEFDVWASPPSSKVYELTSERSVQAILYSIRETPIRSDEVARIINEPALLVTEKLIELEKFNLVRKENERWVCNIPLYMEEEIREAEKIGLAYAEKEAAILRGGIPSLKTVYSKTTLSKYFSWDEVSLVIVGAFLADFCVVDRIPFKGEHFTEDLQPPLKTNGGKRWGYTGFEKLPKRFPSRRWKFYQNVSSKTAGGMSRFGYYRTPSEERIGPPSRPESWSRVAEGRILLALAEGPRVLQELQNATNLKRDLIEKKLKEMTTYNPPAVTLSNDKYRAEIPLLTESDLLLLIPECDRIAEEVFSAVVLPHLEARRTRAKQLGYSWPLPADTYVRDKAIEILVDEGLLHSVPPPPVDWNFGLWGWNGFLRMQDQITEDMQADSFLKTTVSREERRIIMESDSIKQRILAGLRFIDTSTPSNAFLSRLSGFVNSDLRALKAVQVPNDHINEDYLERPSNKRWLEHLLRTKIMRVRPTANNPMDGEASPVFTIDDEGYEEAHIFFFHQGSWKLLFNTPRVGLWHVPVKTAVQEKMKYLESR